MSPDILYYTYLLCGSKSREVDRVRSPLGPLSPVASTSDAMHQPFCSTAIPLTNLVTTGRRRKVVRFSSSCSIYAALTIFVIAAALALPHCCAFRQSGAPPPRAIVGLAMDRRKSHMLLASVRGGKPPKPERSKNVGHIEDAMLKHDVLTKAEEQALALKIRRAQHIRAELEKLLLGQQQVQQDIQQQKHDSVFFVEEQHSVDQDTDELLLFPRESLIEEGEEEDDEYTALSNFSPLLTSDEFDNYQLWSSKSFILEKFDKMSLRRSIPVWAASFLMLGFSARMLSPSIPQCQSILKLRKSCTISSIRCTSGPMNG